MSYLGIDVSKATMDCCLYIGDLSSKKKSKSFKNNDSGFSELQKWLLRYDVVKATVVLEATGIYHEKLCYALYALGHV